MNKRFIIACLKYGLGIGVLAFEIWRKWEPANGSPGLKVALASPLQLLPFVIAVGCYVIAVLLTFLRWYVLVRAQQLPFTPFNALRLGLIGVFLSTFLPGSIGGDVFKAAFLAREQSRRTVAVATVLLDRAMGLWGIFWVVAIMGGAFWLFGDPVIEASNYLQGLITTSIVVICATLFFCFILAILPPWRAERFAGRLSRIPKLGTMASEFWRAIWMYRLQRGSVALALLISLTSQFFLVFTFFFVAQTFDNPNQPAPMPSLREHFVIVPIGTVVLALFPTPGGVGGAEAFFGWLYGRVDESMSARGVLGSLGQRVIICGFGFIGYFIYLRMRPSLPAVVDNDSSELASVGASS